jgi:hypothetical protein
VAAPSGAATSFCTTDLAEVARLKSDSGRRKVEPIALSGVNPSA